LSSKIGIRARGFEKNPWYWKDKIKKRNKKKGRVNFDFTVGGLQALWFW
jgi:hypothetical protein